MSAVANQKMGSNSTENSKQVVEEANKRPDWLPEGWIVDVRTRKSGPNMGAVYKCYIEPFNGFKFYSKPEVSRYLNAHSENGNNLKKGCTVTHSASNVAVGKSTVDKSLPGSTKEIKIAKNNNAIKSDPCYTDPVNEYQWKMEGLQYDEPGDISTHLFKPDKRPIQDEAISTVAIEKSTADDLPPGWTKEVKIRKNSSGTRKDPYYRDPVNGYVFRSKKDAWRYIESGDITRCLYKPTKRQIEDEDNSAPSSTAKRQKLKRPATKRQLFVGRKISGKGSIKLSDTNSSEEGHNVKVSTTETAVKMHSLEGAAANTPEMNETSDPADVQGKNHVQGMLKNADKKNHRSPNTSKKEEWNVPRRFSRRLSGVEPDRVADPDIIVTEQALLVPKRSLAKGELLNKSNRISQGQGDFGEQSNHNSLSNDYISPSLNGATKTTGEIGKLGAEGKKSSNKKVNVPHRASKRLAGFEPDITDSMICDRPPEYKGKMSKVEANAESRQVESIPAQETAYASSSTTVPRVGKSSVRSKSSPKIPPRTFEQEEKLGEKQLDDEKSESQLSFAFHYSWSDPSVEFAIKTLTGTIPVENSADKGPVLVPEADGVDKTKLSKNVAKGQGPVLVPEADEVDKTKLSKNVTEGQGPGLVPEADGVDKTELSENVTELQGPVLVPEAEAGDKTNMSKSGTKGSNDKNQWVLPKKSKNKKEPSFPRRLSKRLAGHEPEIAPADRAVEYTSKKSCKDELRTAATSHNIALKHIDVGDETELNLQAPASPKTRVLGESSNKNEKSNEVQITPHEQLQKVEAEKVNRRSESEVSLPFGDSWSDPCFEFAIKTLTGALPVDGFEEVMPVVTPDLNCLPNTGLLESVVVKRINEETHDNMNQSQSNEDVNKVCQLSKRLPDQPESFIGATSCENAPKFATIEYHGDDDKITRDLKQSHNNVDVNEICQPSKQFLVQPELLINSTSCEMVCQPSKDLLGHAELRSSSASCENTPKFISRECQGDESKITNNLDERASLNIGAGNEFQLAYQSRNIDTSTVQGSSNIIGKVFGQEFAPAKQPQLKTQIENQDESELRFSAPLIDSWSDPCQYRNIGSSRVQVSSNNIGKVFGQEFASAKQPQLETRMENQDKSKLQFSTSLMDSWSDPCQSRNIDTSRVQESSNNIGKVFGLEFASAKQPQLETRMENQDKSKLLFSTSLMDSWSDPCQSRNIDTSRLQESSNNIGKVLGQEFAPAKQPQLETRIENQDKSAVLQFSAPLVDSWSDPCLEFAFNTLTGALPVEENLSIQGCFQEPANNFYSQKDACPTLPDFESPSFPRPEISFHYNAKSMPGQQTSMSSPSILPPERVNPHWFPGFDSQKHYSQSSKNSQGG